MRSSEDSPTMLVDFGVDWANKYINERIITVSLLAV
mgnify:CR=1 FL=1